MSAQIVDNLRVLTAKSKDALGPAESITILNAPLFHVGQGPFPIIIATLNEIISTRETVISQMQSMGQVTEPTDSENIFSAFREFVRALLSLVSVLIGKAKLIQGIPGISAPVTNALRGLEAVLDEYSVVLVENIPSRSADLVAEGNSCSTTIAMCIDTYQEMA